MCSKIKYIFLAVYFVISCNREKTKDDFPVSQTLPPKATVFDTVNPYKFNPVTSDSVAQVMRNPYGDTAITGKRIFIQPRKFTADSIWDIRQSRLKSPKIIPAHSNRVEFSGKNDSYPLSELQPGEYSEEEFLEYRFVNYSGDTIISGEPVSVQPVVKRAKTPVPVKASDPSFADNALYHLRFFSVDHGLSSPYAWSVLEDQRGFIWIATNDGGLVKYDGENFSVFTTQHGLGANIVYSMTEDKKGNLWLATDNGLQKYDGINFHTFSENIGLNSNAVRCVLEDHSGKIWIGTEGGGVSCYDGRQFIHYALPEWKPHYSIYSMAEDKEGNIWMGTNGSGVAKFDGKKFTVYTTESGLSDNHVLSIYTDRKGKVWMGTYLNGITVFDGKSFSQITASDGLSSPSILAFHEDVEGNMWLGTYGQGIVKFDGKNFTTISAGEGLSNEYIRAINSDRFGNLWICTYGGGINILNETSFFHFTKQNGLPVNLVYGTGEDKEKNIWLATWGEGAVNYNGIGFSQFTEKEGLLQNLNRQILTDDSGNVWIGSNGYGISVIEKDNVKNLGATAVNNGYILSTLKDSRGNLWFGTSGGGAFYFDGSFWYRISVKEGMVNNYIMSMTEDSRGNIWLGTHGGGVSVFDGISLINYTEKEGLLCNRVWALYTDKKGNIWMGTNGNGIACYDGKQWKNFREENGLSNGFIQTINEDNKGNIWVGTGKGIDFFTENNNNGYSLHYGFGKEDGLRAPDIVHGSGFYSSDNKLWWGSGKGLVTLNLNRFHFPEKLPVTSLTDIYINEQHIDWNNQPDTLLKYTGDGKNTPFFNYPSQLELPYHINHLTFYFTSTDASPHKVKYSYQMEGLDPQWSIPSSSALADYRNIPYGTYTFKVKSTGATGKWSEPVQYTFTIFPPWWHTWWFRVIMVLCFVLILFLLFRWRTSALRKRQAELEETVRIRTSEVVREKKEVEHQKELVEEKNKEILDSITYAKRLQEAILPPLKIVKEYLPESFILYKPKDIVAGDFYFMESFAEASDSKGKNNNHVVFAAADCTGHGVPGAMVSVVCSNALNRAVKEFKLTDPGLILDKVRELVVETFEKSESEVKDGMDISLCILDTSNNELKWAGANNPLWVVKKGQEAEDKGQVKRDEKINDSSLIAHGLSLIEIKPDKQPIGKYAEARPFTTHTVQLQKGDTIYIFTDGYEDQFGGDKGKKFKSANMKKLLLDISSENMETQREKISFEFEKWKGELEQVDDVCVIGVRI